MENIFQCRSVLVSSGSSAIYSTPRLESSAAAHFRFGYVSDAKEKVHHLVLILSRWEAILSSVGSIPRQLLLLLATKVGPQIRMSDRTADASQNANLLEIKNFLRCARRFNRLLAPRILLRTL